MPPAACCRLAPSDLTVAATPAVSVRVTENVVIQVYPLSDDPLDSAVSPVAVTPLTVTVTGDGEGDGVGVVDAVVGLSLHPLPSANAQVAANAASVTLRCNRFSSRTNKARSPPVPVQRSAAARSTPRLPLDTRRTAADANVETHPVYRETRALRSGGRRFMIGWLA